jgi:hypothetical protein
MIPETGEEIKPVSHRCGIRPRRVPLCAVNSRGLTAPGEAAVEQTNGTVARDGIQQKTGGC